MSDVGSGDEVIAVRSCHCECGCKNAIREGETYTISKVVSDNYEGCQFCGDTEVVIQLTTDNIESYPHGGWCPCMFRPKGRGETRDLTRWLDQPVHGFEGPVRAPAREDA